MLLRRKTPLFSRKKEPSGSRSVTGTQGVEPEHVTVEREHASAEREAQSVRKDPVSTEHEPTSAQHELSVAESAMRFTEPAAEDVKEERQLQLIPSASSTPEAPSTLKQDSVAQDVALRQAAYESVFAELKAMVSTEGFDQWQDAMQVLAQLRDQLKQGMREESLMSRMRAKYAAKELERQLGKDGELRKLGLFETLSVFTGEACKYRLPLSPSTLTTEPAGGKAAKRRSADQNTPKAADKLGDYTARILQL
eukprot:scaffold162542_cov35-Tisochrysis_lutea.AAC.1